MLCDITWSSADVTGLVKLFLIAGTCSDLVTSHQVVCIKVNAKHLSRTGTMLSCEYFYANGVVF